MPKKQENKKAASIAIKELFEKASTSERSDADEFVRKARRLAMKHKLRLGIFKRAFCKHCYAYLKPGINCKVRTKDGKVIYHCLDCKKYMRFPVR